MKLTSDIEDLARLAREGCAYRGRSQQADAPIHDFADSSAHGNNIPRLQKLIASFKAIKG